jgi:hypothetical protein
MILKLEFYSQRSHIKPLKPILFSRQYSMPFNKKEAPELKNEEIKKNY